MVLFKAVTGKLVYQLIQDKRVHFFKKPHKLTVYLKRLFVNAD